MPAYATAGCWAELRQRFDYAFKPFSGGYFIRPVLETMEIVAGETVPILGLDVKLLDQDHGYSRSLGLRVRNFAYCTDVVHLDEVALAALTGLDLFVVDCFSRAGKHPTHAGLEQVLAWVERLRPKRTILTHMGPDMDYQALRAILPPEIEPGYDGMVVEL